MMGRSKELCVFTDHSKDRMTERNIDEKDVISALKNGIVIEVNSKIKQDKNCLVLGNSIKGDPLHVAVALKPGEIIILTTYRPNKKRWGDDYKTKAVR